MNGPVSVLLSFHSKLLLLYPRHFQDEFTEEMQIVFQDSVKEAVENGMISMIFICLRELGGLPFSILREFWHEFKRKETIMVTNEKVETEASTAGGASHWDALIGALPFALFGIASMIGKSRLPFHMAYSDLVFFAIILIGLLMGLIKGAPRWIYSYLGWSLVFAWWWTNMYTNGLRIFGHTMYNESWGWRIWYPLFITFGIALLWTRSLLPLRQLVSGIWQDWTLLSLAMYAFVGWMALIYDENHHPCLFAFMTASTLAIAGGAWSFMKSANTRARIIALASGFAAVGVIGWICELTWDWRGYYGLPPQPTVAWYISVLRVVLLFALWGAILFWPALVGLARRNFNKHKTA